MNQFQLKEEHKEREAEIKARLQDYKNAEDQFYELCFCLLTPQSNAFRCDVCIQELMRLDFKHREPQILGEILKKYTRFHNTKAKHLALFKQNHEKIISGLLTCKTPFEKRAFLVKNVKGLGLKEASHFLRNTGHESLAILDRHILKHLVELGVMKRIPKSLTHKNYLKIEKQFQKFSKEIQIPIDEIDLTLWSHETGKVFK
ncbi:MAG: N-glycosylase/DNA lyase [Nanoarchaeota archaeon]|nr:N-glycosylase/DNA lyase [Nanoarchaeota archaeon]